MTQAPTLTRVTRFGFVNAYLVGEEDGLTLIDTTIGKGGARAILRRGRAAGDADRANRAHPRSRRPRGRARPPGTGAAGR